MVTEIFFIRHGSAARDSGIDYHVPPGPPLTEQGLDEARQAAAFLVDKGVEHLFVSPFARTLQTAEPIAGLLQVPVSISTLIEESRTGEPAEVTRERGREFLQTLPPGLLRIGVVTHGQPMRMMLMELSQDRVDLSGYVFDYGNPAPPAGIW